MDRRERKKQATRERIVAAASELFDRQGFAVTTMEDVATRADVGVGTLYNYFGSKDRLLLGVFEGATEELLAAGRTVVEAPGDDPVEAVCQLLSKYVPLATLFDKAVLREMLAAALTRPTEDVEQFTSLDLRLAGSIGELLAALQARGHLAANLDLEAASIALYGALTLPVLLFLGVADMEASAIEAMVRRQVRLILFGLLPRSPRGDATRAPRTRSRRKAQ